MVYLRRDYRSLALWDKPNTALKILGICGFLYVFTRVVVRRISAVRG